jgi:hypothetical protein
MDARPLADGGDINMDNCNGLLARSRMECGKASADRLMFGFAKSGPAQISEAFPVLPLQSG